MFLSKSWHQCKACSGWLASVLCHSPTRALQLSPSHYIEEASGASGLCQHCCQWQQEVKQNRLTELRGPRTKRHRHTWIHSRLLLSDSLPFCSIKCVLRTHSEGLPNTKEQWDGNLKNGFSNSKCCKATVLRGGSLKRWLNYEVPYPEWD